MAKPKPSVDLGVLGRLGMVVYWACIAVAVLLVLGGVGTGSFMIYEDRETLFTAAEPVEDTGDELTDEEIGLIASGDDLSEQRAEQVLDEEELARQRRQEAKMEEVRERRRYLLRQEKLKKLKPIGAIVGVILALALVSWLFGRAAKYVLAGR